RADGGDHLRWNPVRQGDRDREQGQRRVHDRPRAPTARPSPLTGLEQRAKSKEQRAKSKNRSLLFSLCSLLFSLWYQMAPISSLSFDNSYARLSPEFYEVVDPTPLPDLTLIAFNPDAAQLIELDPAITTRDDLASYFSGAR